jgi:hypothetical protein
MPWYRCFVRGENFPLKRPGHGKRKSSGLFGFYATRWVDAIDPDAAELRCVELLRRDKDLTQIKRVEGVTPMIFIEEIEELRGEPETHPGSGFTFFAMES